MDYANAITLALTALNASLKLVSELKQQSGMSDEELLALAEKNGVELRADIAAYVAQVR